MARTLASVSLGRVPRSPRQAYLQRIPVYAGALSPDAKSGADIYNSQIRQIDNLLGRPNVRTLACPAKFFSGIQELASNPSSIPGAPGSLLFG